MLDAFKERCKVDPATGCWIWQKVLHHSGYGHFQTRLAHRVSYEMHVGPIPEGLTLDHLCRNRACVNPEHLEPVTMRDNALRSTSPAARNARRTHCPKGHELSGDNLRMDGGKRKCRACTNARTNEYYHRTKPEPRGNANARKIHCKWGHSLEGDNVYIKASGKRECRTCDNERRRSRYHERTRRAV